MKNVQIKYNPFTVKTDIAIDGSSIDRNSTLYKVCENHRLQEWIEPHSFKDDFFTVLKRTINDKDVNISFCGTTLDFEDLVYGKEHYGRVFENIKLVHEEQSLSGAEKIEKIKILYKKLMDGPVDRLKDESIQKAFKDAINPEFQIVIVAPMSSGKSTLINAILEEDLLPAINQATTAKITRIKDNDDARKFRVTWESRSNIYTEDASLELINKLNSDPNVTEICIEGNIPSVESTKIKLVFVDTPGGNNSQDESHGDIMCEAIKGENNSVILYVFNGSTPTTKDGNEILRMISNAMKVSTNGKQSRDRFLFVANRMDDVNVDKESYQSMVETIKNELGKDEIGISDPKLFLISALHAKLLRLSQKGVDLNSSDQIYLMTGKMMFNDRRRMLTEYATISESARKKLMDEANENMVPMQETILPNNKEKAERAAEINTGLPALELAIRDYLDKYAIAIKVKSAHDAFLRKANVFKMTAEYEERCSASEESYNRNLDELYQKKEELERSNKRKEFADIVSNINFDTENIYNRLAKLLEQIQIKGQQTNKLVNKMEAKKIIDNFKRENEDETLNILASIEEELNESVGKKCEEVINQYRDYVIELDKDGMLNIGGFNITETDAFNELAEKLKNISIANEYVEIRSEKVGEKTYKKTGVFNAVKRFFKNESGWGKEDIFADKEYINIRELIANEVQEIRAEVNIVIKDMINFAEIQLGSIKTFTNDKLSEIDNIILKQLEEFEEKTKDLNKLIEQVKRNKEYLSWLKEFIDDMDNILDI